MRIWWGEPSMADLTAMQSGSLGGNIGIEFTAFGDDWLSARMPVDARTHQPYGRLHGGASVVLAETLASAAGILVVDESKFLAVGLEINANHLRPVAGGFVEATATPEALGRQHHVWTVRIRDATDRLVCIARVTLAILPADRMAVT